MEQQGLRGPQGAQAGRWRNRHDGDDERREEHRGEEGAARGGRSLDRAPLHDPGRAPLRRGHVGASRRRPDELEDGRDRLRAARGRVPRLLVASTPPRSSPRSTSAARWAPRRASAACASSSTASCSPTPRRARTTATSSTEIDAEIFEHELTWMLLHQVFSFNSPVWFNVGTSSPQQVSACFILAVDDTMDSILNWYREEGLIFKGGSGAGLNLSRIRSSKELLLLRRHRQRPGLVHARRRRDRRHHQVRWRHASRGEDGRARRRPPRHRGVRRDQGARGAQDPRAARRRLRHGPRRQGHHLASSTRTPTTRSASRDEFMRAVENEHDFGLRARARPARSSRRSTPDALREDLRGRVGVRRPGHPVRRHHQRLAHQPRDRPHHRDPTRARST